MNAWKHTYWYGAGVLVVLLFLIAMTYLIPQHRKLRELEARRARFQQENRMLEASVGDLKERQDQFNTDPLFVERVAHEAGRVKPGEILYIFEATNRRTSGVLKTDIRKTPKTPRHE